LRLPFFYGWLIVGAAALMAFLGTGLFAYTRGVFLPSMADTFGGRFEVALGFSIEMVVTALSAPLLGRVLDAWSPKTVMLIGIVTVALGYYLLSLVQALWQLYLVMAVCFGLGMGAMGVLPWQKVVVTWFTRRRGLALALGVMGASLAGIFMPPVANALIADRGWQGGFEAYAALVLFVLVPVTWLVMRDRPEQIGEVADGRRAVGGLAGGKEQSGPASTGELLRSSVFWAITLVFAAMLCVLGVVLLHLYGHLLDMGLSEAQAAYAVSLMAIAAAAGKPAVGWVSDAIGVRATVWLSVFIQGLALVLLVGANDAPMAFTAAGIYGVGYSGVASLQSLAVSTAFGSASFGRARGLMAPFMLPATASASPLAGFIYDASGSYTMAFMILAGVLLVAAAGSFLLPRRPVPAVLVSHQMWKRPPGREGPAS
jgi:MFS family permease